MFPSVSLHEKCTCIARSTERSLKRAARTRTRDVLLRLLAGSARAGRRAAPEGRPMPMAGCRRGARPPRRRATASTWPPASRSAASLLCAAWPPDCNWPRLVPAARSSRTLTSLEAEPPVDIRVGNRHTVIVIMGVDEFCFFSVLVIRAQSGVPSEQIEADRSSARGLRRLLRRTATWRCLTSPRAAPESSQWEAPASDSLLSSSWRSAGTAGLLTAVPVSGRSLYQQHTM